MPAEVQLETRVALLEADTKHTHRGLKQNNDDHKEMKEDIKGILSRIDKQNGTLPYLKISMGEIKQDMEAMKSSVSEVREKVFETKVRNSIIWAAIGAIGSLLLTAAGYCIKVYFLQ